MERVAQVVDLSLRGAERAAIERRIAELEERLAWNEAQRWVWNEAQVFDIRIRGLSAKTQQQRCDHFRYRLMKAWNQKGVSL